MRCDFQAFFLAHTLANPCLGRDPQARVATEGKKMEDFQNKNLWIKVPS
jgi:hypothetical protein